MVTLYEQTKGLQKCGIPWLGTMTIHKQSSGKITFFWDTILCCWRGNRQKMEQLIIKPNWNHHLETWPAVIKMSPLSYFIIISHNHFTWQAIMYPVSVFSSLLISPFVSGQKWIWEAVLLHDLFPRGIQLFTVCSPADPSGWSVQASSKWTSLDRFGPDWTFVWDAFFFPPTRFSAVKWQTWQCCHFSPHF